MIVNVSCWTTKTRRAADRDSSRPGDFGVDVEIVIRKHQLPHRFRRGVEQVGEHFA